MTVCTEKEAAEKWCPHARAPHYYDTNFIPVNRDYHGNELVTCIASRCMQWRWADLPSTDRRGYCGLAGRP